MCGDHSDRGITELESKGSPPHVRGPLFSYRGQQVRTGITPACAGTTASDTLPSLMFRDHPRMCGDHIRHINTGYSFKGSPPHVRGPPSLHNLTALLAGITPACAGTTTKMKELWDDPWDHPRMCGDH